MMQKVFIPELNTTITCICRGNTRVWACYPPIFHPAVFLVGDCRLEDCITAEDVIKSLIDFEFACKNPANTYAAVMYKNNRDAFKINNKQIGDIVQSNEKECCVCLQQHETMSISFTCHRFHYVCLACSKQLLYKPCPICRFTMFQLK